MVLKGTHTTPDGARIAYELHGEHLLNKDSKRPPLVLIMGLSGVMPMWYPLAPALGEHRPTLIFDHRGIGLSTLPDEYDIFSLTFDTMTDDLLSLLASFDWGKRSQATPLHILGYSMGGHILQHLLTRSDGAYDQGKGTYTIKDITFSKAVLAATMTKLPRADFSLATVQEIMAGDFKTRADRDRAVTEYMIDCQYYPAWLSASATNRAIREDRIRTSLALKPAQSTVMAQMQAISAVDVRPRLPRIPASFPVLILHGREDRMVAFEETEHTRKGIRHAQTLFVDEVGHFWYDMKGGSAFWVRELDAWLDAGSATATSRL